MYVRFHRRHRDDIQEERWRMVVWLFKGKKGSFSCRLCGGASFKCREHSFTSMSEILKASSYTLLIIQCDANKGKCCRLHRFIFLTGSMMQARCRWAHDADISWHFALLVLFLDLPSVPLVSPPNPNQTSSNLLFRAPWQERENALLL